MSGTLRIKEEREDDNVYSAMFTPEPASNQLPDGTYSSHLALRLRRSPAPSPGPSIANAPEISTAGFSLPIRSIHEPPTAYTSAPVAPLYDPASAQLPSARTLRALSAHNGNNQEAPTACWELFRDQPHRHILMCNHEVDTDAIRQCGGNCRLSSIAESKPRGPMIVCKHRTCVRREAAARSSLFIQKPTKRKPPARESVEEPTSKRRRTPLPNEGASASARRISALPSISEDDKVLMKINEEVAKDESGALARLVASARGPGVRERSVLHEGFALQQERSTRVAASNLQRELNNLGVAGSDSLKYGLPRKKKYDETTFSEPDAVYGAANERERPNSYARAAKLGQKSIRNEQAGMFSVEEATYDRMVDEEAGVTVDQEDLVTDKLPRNQIDRGDEGGAGFYQDAELFCICEQPRDATMTACTRCQKLFHPVCLGKDTGEPVDTISDDDESEIVRKALESKLTGRSCAGCEKDIKDVRYMCNICPDLDYCHACFNNPESKHDRMHGFEIVYGSTGHLCDGCSEYIYDVRHACLTCRNVDYCENCYRDGLHMHNDTHELVEIHGNGLGVEDTADGEREKNSRFTCLDCDQKAEMEALAQQTMGSKHLSIAELREQNVRKREKMKKAMTLSRAQLRNKRRVDLRNARTDEDRDKVYREYAQLGLEQNEIERMDRHPARVSKSSKAARSTPNHRPQMRGRRANRTAEEERMAEMFGDDEVAEEQGP